MNNNIDKNNNDGTVLNKEQQQTNKKIKRIILYSRKIS